MFGIFTYQSNRINTFWTFFQSWIIGILPIGLLAAIESYFHFLATNRSLIPILSIVAVIKLIYDGLTETRINSIDIDDERKRIRIRFYNLYEGQHERVFQLSDLAITINRKNNKWWNFSPVVKMDSKEYGDFSVARYKDGFSTSTLENLADNLELLTTPVK